MKIDEVKNRGYVLAAATLLVASRLVPGPSAVRDR